MKNRERQNAVTLLFSSFFLLIGIALGSVCLAVIIGCGDAQSTKLFPEGVYASPSVCDLGSIVGAETITGTFKITNTTKKAVNIHKIKLSCGCADAQLSSETIPAGGSIDVVMTVDLQGRYGQYIFEALVMTDDINNPHIPLHIKVDAAKKQLDGTILFDLGKMGPGDSFNQTFSTLPGKINTVTVENITSKAPDAANVKANVAAEVFAHEKVILKITGTAPEQNGEFIITAKLKSVGSDWGEATVQFNGIVRPDIALPPSIPMGFIEKGTKAVKRVDFSAPVDFFSKVKIEKIEVKNPLPDYLSVKLINAAIPYLECSLNYVNGKETLSQNIELEFYLSNGKKYQFSTGVIARFL